MVNHGEAGAGQIGRRLGEITGRSQNGPLMSGWSPVAPQRLWRQGVSTGEGGEGR